MTEENRTEENRTVQYRVEQGIATITLDRPETLNSMSDQLMLDLAESLQQVVDDPTVRVLVLTGSGRGFCSGADLSAVGSDDGDPSEGASLGDLVASGQAVADSLDQVFHPAIRLLCDLPVPTIARVNGVAAGGGFGLALGCDVVIAARSARFVCTFGPRLGIVPDLGTTFHLAHRAGTARARGIAMLGGTISADEAETWGLIWSAVEDDQLDAVVAQTAEQLARSSPDAIVRIRESFEAARTNTLSQQLDVEREHQRILIPRNMGEGAAAFLEKREPTFDGSRRERQ